jgi:hypothetical protein
MASNMSKLDEIYGCLIIPKGRLPGRDVKLSVIFSIF